MPPKEREDDIISSQDYAKILATKKKNPSYPFGIPTVDLLTGGVEPGELIIFTGYSGHGKTSILQSFTVGFEKAGVPTMWFSYEVTPQQFFGKFNVLPQFYLPRNLTDKSIAWIGERIQEGIDKYGIKIVFIDHLHYLIDMMPSSNGNSSLVIGSLLRNLKRMCIDKNITICLVAHTSQPKDDKLPDMNSLRDSSFIAQESDAVYAMCRVKEKKLGAELYTNQGVFLILKQRRMGTMGRRVKLDYVNNLFIESIRQD